MAKTYLDIVNEVLMDTNEVSLNAGNFGVTRGFHSFVKLAVNRALMDIVNESDEWPWLANSTLDSTLSLHTNVLTLVEDQIVYTIQTLDQSIDWDTMVIHDIEDNRSYPLCPVSAKEWQRERSWEAKGDRNTEEKGRPTHVYRTHDHLSIAFTSVPDKAYEVRYTTWKAPTFLTAYTDTLPFPDKFFNVLVNRARYYAWMFRENKDQAGFADKDYNQTLTNMKRIMIRPIFTRMRAV